MGAFEGLSEILKTCILEVFNGPIGHLHGLQGNILVSKFVMPAMMPVSGGRLFSQRFVITR